MEFQLRVLEDEVIQVLKAYFLANGIEITEAEMNPDTGDITAVARFVNPKGTERVGHKRESQEVSHG